MSRRDVFFLFVLPFLQELPRSGRVPCYCNIGFITGTLFRDCVVWFFKVSIQVSIWRQEHWKSHKPERVLGPFHTLQTCIFITKIMSSVIMISLFTLSYNPYITYLYICQWHYVSCYHTLTSVQHPFALLLLPASSLQVCILGSCIDFMIIKDWSKVIK